MCHTAVSIADNFGAMHSKSSVFEVKIRGFKSRADYNGADMVAHPRTHIK